MLYSILKPIIWVIAKLIYFLEVENKSQYPEGKIIICANHKSLLDPILLAGASKRKVHFMAKKELFQNKILAWLIRSLGSFPVDRQGLDRQALKTASNILQEEKVLGIFPEGTRIRNIEDISRDKFNNGIAMIASKDNSDILPVTIEGNYKPFRKMRVVFHDVIKINEIEGENRKEIYNNIVDQVYNSIYKNYRG